MSVRIGPGLGRDRHRPHLGGRRGDTPRCGYVTESIAADYLFRTMFRLGKEGRLCPPLYGFRASVLVQQALVLACAETYLTAENLERALPPAVHAELGAGVCKATLECMVEAELLERSGKDRYVPPEAVEERYRYGSLHANIGAPATLQVVDRMTGDVVGTIHRADARKIELGGRSRAIVKVSDDRIHTGATTGAEPARFRPSASPSVAFTLGRAVVQSLGVAPNSIGMVADAGSTWILHGLGTVGSLFLLEQWRGQLGHARIEAIGPLRHPTHVRAAGHPGCGRDGGRAVRRRSDRGLGQAGEHRPSRPRRARTRATRCRATPERPGPGRLLSLRRTAPNARGPGRKDARGDPRIVTRGRSPARACPRRTGPDPGGSSRTPYYWHRMRAEDPTPQGSQIERPLTVLMADIVNSTSLYESLGDLRARKLVGSGLEVMTTTVASHGGRLVKSLGDGILACFDSPAAVSAALELSERVSSLALEVRVGVHHGSVIDDGLDIFGDTVNTTARLASAARPAEVLCSKQVWEQLPPEVRARGRSIPAITVKGKREPLEVFSIITDCEEYAATLVDDHTARQRNAPAACLELTFLGECIRLEGAGNLLIGRGQECAFRIEHDKTSRTHARIYYRAPAFMLEDSSTNGTTVVQDSGAQALIHRGKTALIGHGEIYPGPTPGTANAPVIEFRVL